MTIVHLLAACLMTAWVGRPPPDFDEQAIQYEFVRFPPQAVVHEWRRTAEEHLCWLRQLDDFTRGLMPDLDERIAEQQRVILTYELLIVARNPPRVPADWERMATLRRMLGDEWYTIGRLPAPLPALERP